MFRVVREGLKLKDLCTPAGLREGGATEFWTRTQQFSRLRLRGRWSDVKVLGHYIQEAIVFLADLCLGQDDELLRLARRVGVALFKQYLRRRQ